MKRGGAIIGQERQNVSRWRIRRLPLVHFITHADFLSDDFLHLMVFSNSVAYLSLFTTT